MTIAAGTEKTITVSVGLAGIDGNDDDLLDLDTLIRQADGALYRAKGAGRNTARAAAERDVI